MDLTVECEKCSRWQTLNQAQDSKFTKEGVRFECASIGRTCGETSEGDGAAVDLSTTGRAAAPAGPTTLAAGAPQSAVNGKQHANSTPTAIIISQRAAGPASAAVDMPILDADQQAASVGQFTSGASAADVASGNDGRRACPQRAPTATASKRRRTDRKRESSDGSSKSQPEFVLHDSISGHQNSAGVVAQFTRAVPHAVYETSPGATAVARPRHTNNMLVKLRRGHFIGGVSNQLAVLKMFFPTIANGDVIWTPEEVARTNKVAEKENARLLAVSGNPQVVGRFFFCKADGAKKAPAVIGMEDLGNESLEMLLESGTRVKPYDAVRWTVNVLTAVSACHVQQIMHHDLKPANVMMVLVGGRSYKEAKVIDFSAGRDNLLTHTGTTTKDAFTHVYAAPEVINPDSTASNSAAAATVSHGLANQENVARRR